MSNSHIRHQGMKLPSLYSPVTGDIITTRVNLRRGNEVDIVDDSGLLRGHATQDASITLASGTFALFDRIYFYIPVGILEQIYSSADCSLEDDRSQNRS